MTYVLIFIIAYLLYLLLGLLPSLWAPSPDRAGRAVWSPVAVLQFVVLVIALFLIVREAAPVFH